MNTAVDGFELPLEGPGYEPGDGKATFEIRDWGTTQRSIVVALEVDGQRYVGYVDWEKYAAETDAMRQRLLGGDWDTALASLMGRNQT